MDNSAEPKNRYEKVINLEQNLYNRPCYCPKCDGVMIFVGCGCYKCEDCHHEMKDDWGKVRDYLYEPENRGKNALDIEQDLGIPRREVQAMLREGKIQYSSEGLSSLMCQMCGTIITHGKYCEPCEKQLHKAKEEELKAQKMKARQSAMHIRSGTKVDRCDHKRRRIFRNPDRRGKKGSDCRFRKVWFFFEFLPRTIMVTSFLTVVLEVVCTIRDTKITSAGEKTKGAD